MSRATLAVSLGVLSELCLKWRSGDLPHQGLLVQRALAPLGVHHVHRADVRYSTFPV